MNKARNIVSTVGRGVLPVPPVISQRGAVLPDGTIDPDAASDCGEACCASVLSAVYGTTFSPGCVRQALGPYQSNGFTTGEDLAELLGRFLPGVAHIRPAASDLWRYCHHLRRSGAYLIVLGSWIVPTEMHWRLMYEGDAKIVWGVDPWFAAHVGLRKAELFQHVALDVVTVGRSS